VGEGITELPPPITLIPKWKRINYAKKNCGSKYFQSLMQCCVYVEARRATPRAREGCRRPPGTAAGGTGPFVPDPRKRKWGLQEGRFGVMTDHSLK